MVRKAFYWGLFGLIAGPIVIYLMILLVLYTDADCKAGIAENCTLDPGLNLVIGAVVGFIGFFLFSLSRAIIRKAREE